MISKLISWLFGKHAVSTISGVVGGAVTSVATVAATGNIDKASLTTAAIAGAAAALTGAAGRGTKEG